MDTEDTMEAKCENLMINVVESRKHFRRMCNEYDQKCSIVETKLLNLQMETFNNISFKPKHPMPNIDANMNEIDDFLIETAERQKRIEDIKAKLKNTQAVVMQLKSDNIGKILRAPLDPSVMLEHAREKNYK
ncbi:hypothetical protein K1T71_014467 [Dendrolimus kikuchii]|uniref:Uncharacterized protein n=1 Tax=Dendrolimus kikuchii TaxID=765133 RepID=A0ACC1CE69_9NEOP|nr:hypothetical protein K1T71_014467 [Dendrolimus kikuchii]